MVTTTPPPQSPPQPSATPPSASDPLGTTNELMTKIRIPLFLFCIFIAFVIVVIIFFLTQPKGASNKSAQTITPTAEVTEEPTVVPTFEATPSADLPPLYPGVEWEATESGKIFFVDKDRNTVKKEGYSLTSKSTNSFSSKMLDYYTIQLTSNGWTKTLEAGGENGQSFGYEKTGRFLNYGYKRTASDASQFQMYIEYN